MCDKGCFYHPVAVLLIIFCVMIGYNAPQPLFPAISATFGLKASEVALMVTCVIFPLGIGPIVYGILLCKWPLLRTLVIALTVYAAGIVPAAIGFNFAAILAGRMFQGLALPCIMVCIMTWFSLHYSGANLQKNLGYYSFCVIIGSYSGRLVAGAAETLSGDWRVAFLVIFAIVALSLPFCLFLKQAPRKGSSFDLHALSALLRQKHLLRLMFLPCPILIASTSVMQALPFRLRELDPQISALNISIIYTGIILCAVTGLFTAKLLALFKSEIMGICLGLLVFICFFPLLAVRNVLIFSIAFICMNFGFAFVYVSLPGIINRYSMVDKSVTNGAYLSLYYTTASLGSYFPLRLMEWQGYYIYLSCMFFFALASLLLGISLRNIRIDSQPARAGV